MINGTTVIGILHWDNCGGIFALSFISLFQPLLPYYLAININWVLFIAHSKML